MITRRNIRVDSEILKDIDFYSEKKGFKNSNEYIGFLLKKGIDEEKIKESNTYILNEVNQIFESQLYLFEQNISQRILKLISNLAIEQGVLNLLLSNSLELGDEDRKEARKIVIENIKENNNLFRYAKR
ncbi:hypothetical protein [Clostridium thermobutyricum]|uniref:hypothetical protein n=1 Tax=Clostridium thermobutyricum TaxID=29372 RepID=UPI002942215D|nr:hypothetical protein [Clostridium thermobutyricum]